MKKIYTLLCGGFAVALLTTTNAQSFVEEFENFNAGVPAGWDTTNLSFPMGVSSWFQGNLAIFTSKSLNGYVGANWKNADSTVSGTISNWLFAPVRTLNNGDMIHFYSRTIASSPFPDRMQVRLSQNGASVNVGTGAMTVGDFTNTLLDINPTYLTTASGGYPGTWTMFMIMLSGLPGGGVSGRFAFRYFVEDGGGGTRSNYIGIDSVAYISILSGIENIVSSAISIYPNPAKDNIKLDFGSANPLQRTITITDIIGRVVFEQVFNENSISIDVADLNAGSYILTTKGEDGVGTKKLVIE